MNLLPLAWRNVLRNGRRSLLTLAAVAVAASAMLLLGGYVKAMMRALETDTVRQVGHLQIMRQGFLQFGRGNAGRFALRDYETLVADLRADPELASMLAVVTPVLQVQGVAGHAEQGSSTNFAGTGWDPVARLRMLEWDGMGLRLPPAPSYLERERPAAGVVGVGLAQLLGLCEALGVPDCAPLPRSEPARDAPAIGEDLARLARQAAPAPVAASGPATLELMAAGVGGAPNVIRMEALRAQRQGARELDAVYVGMPLELAQRLQFGPAAKGASAIVLQLVHGTDLARAKARVEAVLGPRMAALEMHDFHVIQPSFDQVVNMFTGIFRFVAILMGVVTLFTVSNTINMAVGERVGEIGSLRAIGFKRRHVRGMFLLEGGLLGLLGGVLGALGAVVLGELLLNQSGLSWTPPGRTGTVPIGVDVVGQPAMVAGALALFAVLACVSAWWPARRAARLDIVEALRHA